MLLKKFGHGTLFFAVLIVFFFCFTVSFVIYESPSYDYSTAIDEVSMPELLEFQPDSVLTKSLRTLLNRYRPPNAFILIMDAEIGSVLAWGQREDDRNSEEPTFLQRDSFPAASLAKIVTATAALEDGNYSNSEFPRIGRNSTLYKRQIFPAENYKGNTITLEDAFAKSNNPAMGIIGMRLGKDKMQSTAEKLGFSNFVYPDSAYELAESSSGFTRRNMLSPFQVANAVRKLLFTKPPGDFQERTYEEMRGLFLKTVRDGTARKDIQKSVHSGNKNSLYIGGKTGSLDGDAPAGRYDWFAGFAQSKEEPQRAIVIIVMQVHGELRNQHSSIIAGLLINEWAKRR